MKKTGQWKEGQDRLTYAEIEQYLRTSTGIDKVLEKGKTSPHYEGVFARPPLFNETARISAPLFVFTGSLDLQTPPTEALKLGETCKSLGKNNCRITILSGLGHGFSPPRGPRRHPLADLTVGPIYPELVMEMEKLVTSLGKK